MANDKELKVGGTLDLYNEVREVPKEAQKTIGGGRLKGMTDINPMWRIKTLTEQFGICGIGWYIEVLDKWLDAPVNGSDEIIANVKIALYIKVDGEWSKPIIGVGGAMFVTKEKMGLYVDDECYKKAYTDAISVACKALGIGADVYWSSDRTKYTQKDETPTNELATPTVSYDSLLKEAKAQMDLQVSAEAVREIYKNYAQHLDAQHANELAQYGKEKVAKLS
jgi:hypothetical protein